MYEFNIYSIDVINSNVKIDPSIIGNKLNLDIAGKSNVGINGLVCKEGNLATFNSSVLCGEMIFDNVTIMIKEESFISGVRAKKTLNLSMSESGKFDFKQSETVIDMNIIKN